MPLVCVLAGAQRRPEGSHSDRVFLCPELNPVEHLWEYLREHHLGNFYWNSLDDLENHLVNVLHHLKFHPQSVHSLAGFSWTFLPFLN